MQAAPGILLDRHTPPAPEAWLERLDGDPRWRVAQGVVSSRHFARSPLLSRFLLYVVTETLEGRQGEITEHQIGVQVFGRPETYRTVEDNIVRNYARQLRKRLAEHFADGNCREAMRIEIPVGGYVPVFTDRTPGARHEAGATLLSPAPAASGADSSVNASEQDRTRQRGWRQLRGVAVLIAYSALLVALTWLAVTRLGPNRSGPAAVAEPAHLLWRTMLQGPENTLIVPPDAGFNLIEDISQQSVPLAEYMHNSYRELPLPRLDEHSRTDLRGQQLTDFVDLQLVARILKRPEYDSERVLLRFPRDLRLDDLKNSNAILIGSVCSNPWSAVKGEDANFSIVCGNGMQGSSILNRTPQAGEAATYISRWNEPTHVTYALISLMPNLSGTGHLLLLEGLDVAGTQAASEAILQSETIEPILRRAKRPDGTLRPFEVLLRSTSIQANATDTQVIASRIH